MNPVVSVYSTHLHLYLFFFFFNAPATTEIYTLSLHDALPICFLLRSPFPPSSFRLPRFPPSSPMMADRKSTRLNSSHVRISYAVFCLKKKKTNTRHVDPSCITVMPDSTAAARRAASSLVLPAA